MGAALLEGSSSCCVERCWLESLWRHIETTRARVASFFVLDLDHHLAVAGREGHVGHPPWLHLHKLDVELRTQPGAPSRSRRSIPMANPGRGPRIVALVVGE